MALDENSKRTRVEPIFGWLRDTQGTEWPTRLVALVEDLPTVITPGPLIHAEFEIERRIRPSRRRLKWMVENADRLTPREGARWRELRSRLSDEQGRNDAVAALAHDGEGVVPRRFILEGSTCADCLIECEHAVIWIEGKRNDWLDYSTTWDVTPDQLARNAEAAWLHAATLDKDVCLIVCYEERLKHHEQLLIDGYRNGTWTGGWPHLDEDERRLLGRRLGTLRWERIVKEWPDLRSHARGLSGLSHTKARS